MVSSSVISPQLDEHSIICTIWLSNLCISVGWPGVPLFSIFPLSSCSSPQSKWLTTNYEQWGSSWCTEPQQCPWDASWGCTMFMCTCHSPEWKVCLLLPLQLLLNPSFSQWALVRDGHFDGDCVGDGVCDPFSDKGVMRCCCSLCCLTLQCFSLLLIMSIFIVGVKTSIHQRDPA